MLEGLNKVNGQERFEKNKRQNNPNHEESTYDITPILSHESQLPFRKNLFISERQSTANASSWASGGLHP